MATSEKPMFLSRISASSFKCSKATIRKILAMLRTFQMFPSEGSTYSILEEPGGIPAKVAAEVYQQRRVDHQLLIHMCM